MELMIDYGFNKLNLHRIDLGVHEFNERGRKAYKKLGFVEEGRKRDGHYANGKYHDVILMSILKNEWKKNKNR
jgi:RimJ/RimL family protein N-acetyltransferase